jgi:transcriptional regulator with XRE-family HTH domain
MSRRRVREALRRARQASGLTQEQAARALDWSLSKLVRIEAGQTGISVTDVQALLDLYGVPAHQADPVTAMARAARRRPWFARHKVAAVVPGLAQYLEAETAAARICGCRVAGVPDLLQTVGYARAFLTGLGAPRIQERVDLLLARQQILDRDDCPQIRYLLDEGALYRSVGGTAVLHAQLRHLAVLDAHPRLSIRVVPYTAGAYAIHETSYTITEFPAGDADLYLEIGDGIVRAGKRGEIACFRQSFAAAQQLSTGIQSSGLLTAAIRFCATAAAIGSSSASSGPAVDGGGR